MSSTMKETEIDPVCDTPEFANAKERIRNDLEDCGDSIEKIIRDNADLIQDFRFKYQEKLKNIAYSDETLIYEFGEKVLELIDRKLNDQAEEDAEKEILG